MGYLLSLCFVSIALLLQPVNKCFVWYGWHLEQVSMLVFIDFKIKVKLFFLFRFKQRLSFIINA